MIARLESERGCAALLGVAMVASGSLAMWLTRGTTFFLDDVTFFLTSHGFEPRAILTPANGHLLAVPRLIYAAVFELFGADYVVLRLVEAIGIVLVAGLLFALVRRRVGAPAALGPSVVLLFFGSTTIIPLSADGMPIVYSVAAALGALLALERPGRRGNGLACALLTLSIATYSLGLVFLVGAAVSVLMGADRRSRAWVVAVPAVLYGLWLLFAPSPAGEAFTGLTGLRLSNVLLVPSFLADTAAATAAALSGLSYDFSGSGLGLNLDSSWGQPLALILLAALVLRLRRGRISSSLWASMATLLALWGAEAMVTGPLRPPDAGRYVYPAAVVVLLVAGHAVRSARLSRRTTGILLVLAAVSLATNLAQLRNAGRFLRSYAPGLRAQITALELARDRVAPGFVPAAGPLRLFGKQVEAQTLLAALDRNGSFAFSLPELRAAPESARALADSTLAAALRLGPAASGAPRPGRGCVRLDTPTAAGLELTLRPPGAAVRASTTQPLALRRFATMATAALGRLPAARFVAIRIPADRANEPWRAVLPAAAGPATVCELGPASG
jgi:hypothetical protein